MLINVNLRLSLPCILTNTCLRSQNCFKFLSACQPTSSVGLKIVHLASFETRSTACKTLERRFIRNIV